MSFEPIWGAIIAWYLFLAGLGGGAFITSAFLGWRHPEAVSMRKVGHLIAPIAVIVGLVLLMFDAEGGLHNPLRFALLLTNFGSVMTWGVVFLGGFTVVALVVVVLDFLKKSVPVWLDIVGVVFAVCVGAYTGALLGVCKTFPLWNNALLPILFLVSAVSAGAASVLLVAVIRHADEFNRVGVLKKFHFCLPIIELVLVAALMFITSSNSVAGWNSVMSLLIGRTRRCSGSAWCSSAWCCPRRWRRGFCSSARRSSRRAARRTGSASAPTPACWWAASCCASW